MPSTRRVNRQLGYLFACGLATLTGLTAISACNDDDDADAEHGAHGGHNDDHANEVIGKKTGTTCPSGSTVSYENFGKKFMQDYCLSCHSMSVTGDARNGAPPDHNFDSLASIALLKGHIDQLAGSGPDATNEMMPPAGAPKKPSMEEREKLSEWLACGPK